MNVAQQKAQLGHWQWDYNTNLATCSENMSQLLGLEKNSELTLSSLLKDVHPEDLESVYASLDKTMKLKSYQSFTHRLLIDDEVRYIRVIGEVNTDNNGNITSILGISQDITEQQQFEGTLLKKNHLLNLAEQKASMGHWYWQSGTKDLMGSKNLFRLFGLDFQNERIRIKKLLNFVHPEDVDQVKRFTLNAIKNKRVDSLVFRIVLDNDQVKIVRATGEVYVSRDNEIDEILGIFQDITAQRAQETKFKNLLDSAPNPTFIVRHDRTIDMINDEAQKLFGYQPEEIVGQSMRKLFPKRFHSMGNALRKNFFNNPKVQVVDLGKDLMMITNKGEEIPIHITIGPVFTDNEVFVSIVARDITKEKRAKRKLLEAKESLEVLAKELKSQNQQLEDFSHITTHNLRAPVNNLNALLKLLKVAKNEEDKAVLFEKQEKVVNHLTLTLNTLVDSLKVKTLESIHLEKLCLKEVLEKTLELLTAEIERTGTVIKGEFSAIDYVVYNKIYLESLFLNLISNSIKYKHPDRTPEILITSQVSNSGQVKLHFTDNGLGMDLDRYGSKLFKMNKVFHNHPEAKGIGLYMTKTQLEALGGTITAESEVGKGTTFEIIFKNQKEN
nr:PAS domain S-box protein [Pseudozobellia sp. WGM2]